MSFKKQLNWFALMPSRSINIKPYRISFKPITEVMKHIQKTFPISSFCPYKTVSSQQRSNPARNIKSLFMLTCGRNSQRVTPFSPAHTQSRMQRKSCLILENHSLTGSQCIKFFLKPFGTSWLLRPWLADTYSWLASGGVSHGSAFFITYFNQKVRNEATQKMRAGPSEPAYRSWFQSL